MENDRENSLNNNTTITNRTKLRQLQMTNPQIQAEGRVNDRPLPSIAMLMVGCCLIIGLWYCASEPWAWPWASELRYYDTGKLCNGVESRDVGGWAVREFWSSQSRKVLSNISNYRASLRQFENVTHHYTLAYIQTFESDKPLLRLLINKKQNRTQHCTLRYTLLTPPQTNSFCNIIYCFCRRYFNKLWSSSETGSTTIVHYNPHCTFRT